MESKRRSLAKSPSTVAIRKLRVVQASELHMRWFWIDRFIEFESGQHAVADQERLAGRGAPARPFSRRPMMPNSLIIEGLAQTGGLLVGEYNDFAQARGPGQGRQGDVSFAGRARRHADLPHRDRRHQRRRRDGHVPPATSATGCRPRSRCSSPTSTSDHGQGDCSSPRSVVDWLRILGVFEVGRKRRRQPLEVPAARWPTNGFNGARCRSGYQLEHAGN